MSIGIQRTDDEFEQLSWHDNHLYGVHISIGDIQRGDWRSDLVFDIDFIVEWICEAEGSCQFLVAPATLTFHHVTDLRMAIDWGTSEFQTAIYEVSISQITRSQIENQKICLDRPYYSWQITTNSPKEGIITFGASDFTQTLRAEPVLIHEQKLSPLQRNSLSPPLV